jgi:transposase-like protein
MERHGRPRIFVTDKLRSYGAAMKEIGHVDRQETGRWLNNRSENFHKPFRRRERAMLRFRCMKTLQKICLRPRFCSQLFQRGAPPPQAINFQAEPRRRSY